MCLFVVWSDCGGKEERREREREKKRAERDGDPNTFTKKSTEQN